MPFAFPDAPVAGQVHSEFGVDYVYDASGVWNLQSGGAMTDYLLKAGDTMTGPLNMAAGSLLTFGAQVDTSLDDFSKHIELYSGTNGMGIGSSTGGQFNFILKNSAHAFNFRVGAATKLQVKSNGCLIPATVAGTGYFIGDPWHGIYFNGSNTLIFTEYHNRFEWRTQTSGTQPGGTVQMSLYAGVLEFASGGYIKLPEGRRLQFHTTGCFLTSSNNNRISYHVDNQHMFFVGGVNMFNIDGVAVRASGPLEAPGFIDRDTGMDLIAEIKALKAEIAELKAQPRGRR